MAWIDEGNVYVWDVQYNRWPPAFQHALEIAEEQHIITEVRPTGDGYCEIFTQDVVVGEHSSACRCAVCNRSIAVP